MSCFARSRRQTSSPATWGSGRSTTSASKGSRARRSSPAAPVALVATRYPASPRYSATIAARRESSSISRMRCATRASLPAVPATPVARRALGEGLALLGGQDLGGVGKRLREAPRRAVRQANLRGAQLLDRRAVDVRSREQLDRLAPGLARLLAQRRELLGRILGNDGELLLLIGRRAGLDGKVLDEALNAFVHLRRVDRPRAESRAGRREQRPWSRYLPKGHRTVRRG